MEWMLLPLKRYAQFSGRARRKEYWMFVLLLVIVYFVAMALDTALGLGGSMTRYADTAPGAASVGFYSNGGVLTIISMLALFLPSLAVAVRRLHDIDKSGWWVLIGIVPLIGSIVLIVFYCLDGTKGPNRFGPDPKDQTPEELAQRFS
ncbi:MULTISPECIES: DUF805 domain-containing protein [Sphingomonadales]|uniref:DUF805 domain-containing protein n=2 Tax=Edaphosphingomonas TaxID=3423724 RepID=A0A2T4HWY0_9SPHN|nr:MULTISPECIES: DUF805 domain-containing protein [Sphingomonas]AGH50805.1 hypothetical protein G432_15435 [Sphingomonas sp. MM-1]MDX3884581.1 DUF805 domain-containing protein [Sphingomonas sp.]OHT19219.1 Inner membrane protein YhaH [Sphingomonas haloaromaticamans]PTD20270.1 DUF805 domain-containing protein [Sphingomonas fennica]